MSTLSLVVDLVVLSLLTFGYNLKRMKKYRQHGITMTTALALHLITIFTWMIWSLINFFSSAPVDFGNFLHLTALAHAALGTIAASLGIWLVGAWHLQTDVQKCFPRRRIMLVTITLWITAILLGTVLYIAVMLS
jgi:hypothetical protein